MATLGAAWRDVTLLGWPRLNSAQVPAAAEEHGVPGGLQITLPRKARQRSSR